MKKILAVIMAVMLLTQPVFAQVVYTGPGPAVPSKYEVELTELKSTNMTTTGNLVQFVNMPKADLQKLLNDAIQGFYDDIFKAALGDGNPPFPSVDFDVHALDDGKVFTLKIMATTVYPDNSEIKLVTITLDDKEYKILKGEMDAQTVIRLSSAASGYYREGKVAMVPFRKVSEFIGFTVNWDGKSATVESKGTKFSVTPGVNNYNGKTLEFAPINKNGSIHVPLSFYTDVLGVFADEHDDEIIIAETVWEKDFAKTGELPATTATATTTTTTATTTTATTTTATTSTSAVVSKSASGGVVFGTVKDATMNGFLLVAADGTELAFPTQAKTDRKGLELDAFVSVEWRADKAIDDIAKADMADITVVRVKSVGAAGATTYTGKITKSTNSSVTIATLSGRTITFALNSDTDVTQAGGLAVGSTVAIEFTGEVVGETPQHYSVLCVLKVD